MLSCFPGLGIPVCGFLWNRCFSGCLANNIIIKLAVIMIDKYD